MHAICFYGNRTLEEDMKMNRRDFLKGATFAAVGAGTIGMLGGCANDADQSGETAEGSATSDTVENQFTPLLGSKVCTSLKASL